MQIADVRRINMKTNNIIAIAQLIFFLAIAVACKKDNDSSPKPVVKTPPTVSNGRVLKISTFSVELSAEVKGNGGDSVLRRGFCYGIRQQPDFSDSVANMGNGLGLFVDTIYGLLPNTKYYFRSFAVNNIGVSFGESITYTTADLPTVESDSAFEITGATVRIKIRVTSDGGDSVFRRGVCFATTPGPTITNQIRTLGSGKGEFEIKLVNLEPSTSYYFKSFAENGVGISYGSEYNFTTTPLFEAGGGVTDVEGYTYPTVKILDIEWMAENLKVIKFRDGSQIAHQPSNSNWGSTTSSAYCLYNNAATNRNVYGVLYNWYTMVDPKGLCPVGWRVPSDADWDKLITYLGGVEQAGGKMKTTGTSQWTAPNAGATNSSGFSGLPGGNRGVFGSFGFLGTQGNWWTTSSRDMDYAFFRALDFNNVNVLRGFDEKKVGMSVRCVKE